MTQMSLGYNPRTAPLPTHTSPPLGLLSPGSRCPRHCVLFCFSPSFWNVPAYVHVWSVYTRPSLCPRVISSREHACPHTALTGSSPPLLTPHPHPRDSRFTVSQCYSSRRSSVFVFACLLWCVSSASPTTRESFVLFTATSPVPRMAPSTWSGFASARAGTLAVTQGR